MIQHLDFLATHVIPTLGMISRNGGPAPSISAWIGLTAIASQESDRLQARVQYQGGPARSYLQIEPPTALAVWDKAPWAKKLLIDNRLDTPFRNRDKPGVQRVLEYSEQVPVILGRGILWLDPSPLPQPGDREGWWKYYLHTWRPGKPRIEKWEGSFRAAHEALRLYLELPRELAAGDGLVS